MVLCSRSVMICSCNLHNCRFSICLQHHLREAVSSGPHTDQDIRYFLSASTSRRTRTSENPPARIWWSLFSARFVTRVFRPASREPMIIQNLSQKRSCNLQPTIRQHGASLHTVRRLLRLMSDIAKKPGLAMAHQFCNTKGRDLPSSCYGKAIPKFGRKGQRCLFKKQGGFESRALTRCTSKGPGSTTQQENSFPLASLLGTKI